MHTNSINYSNLETLSTSDYRLANDGADITGWPVQNEAGAVIGKVNDLLFDPANNAIRYIIVELDLALLNEEKMVLIPIGVADLADDSKTIIVPDFHLDQYAAMPRYIMDEVSYEMEDEIRRVIGSPAALRMEDEIVEIDRENFYRHHHFDRGNLVREAQSRL
ncbi:PRC-barrel domain-containing protein [Pedobacter sp. Leaf170]|uniref:PRC-barrel domain-containing protein n=1 Tax=Pedobacter sp. Leaf170 TaxID=2876558 RepID=UPI001E5C1105|nr:PRC-barrel domain-containing protein [Pedobacter sp. Leaf170]